MLFECTLLQMYDVKQLLIAAAELVERILAHSNFK